MLAPKQRPKAIIHLTGGAFAAAAPNIVVRGARRALTNCHAPRCAQYSLLGHLLSNAGYTVIATPFAVTFQHAACTQQVHEVLAATASMRHMRSPLGKAHTP